METELKRQNIIQELLYKTPSEIEAWLREKPKGYLSRPILSWLVLDVLFERQKGQCAGCAERRFCCNGQSH